MVCIDCLVGLLRSKQLLGLASKFWSQFGSQLSWQRMLRLAPNLVLVEVQWDLQCYSSKYHLSGVRVVLKSFKSLEFSWNTCFYRALPCYPWFLFEQS